MCSCRDQQEGRMQCKNMSSYKHIQRNLGKTGSLEGTYVLDLGVADLLMYLDGLDCRTDT